MEQMKNLCGMIPESLHNRLMEGKDPNMTNGEYLTKVLTAYLDQPGVKPEQRTLAVQISEGMFQQIKAYLDDHKPLTQKAMAVRLVEQALDQWVHDEDPFPYNLDLDNGRDRTLAFAVPVDLFQQVEQYLSDHTGMTKRSFLVGIVTKELHAWEMEQEQNQDEAQYHQAEQMQDEQEQVSQEQGEQEQNEQEQSSQEPDEPQQEEQEQDAPEFGMTITM